MTVERPPGSIKAKTIGELRARNAQGDAAVTLSLALGPGDEPVDHIVKRLLARTSEGGPVDILQIHPLARVVSVRGKPNALVPLIESSEIQDALYTSEPDILPKPVKRRPVDLATEEGFYPVRTPPRSPPRRTGGSPRPGAVPKRPK
jgi:hypothetical protein